MIRYSWWNSFNRNLCRVLVIWSYISTHWNTTQDNICNLSNSFVLQIYHAIKWCGYGWIFANRFGLYIKLTTWLKSGFVFKLRKTIQTKQRKKIRRQWLRLTPNNGKYDSFHIITKKRKKSSRWLPCPSRETFKTSIYVPSDDQGSHDCDIFVSEIKYPCFMFEHICLGSWYHCGADTLHGQNVALMERLTKGVCNGVSNLESNFHDILPEHSLNFGCIILMILLHEWDLLRSKWLNRLARLKKTIYCWTIQYDNVDPY